LVAKTCKTCERLQPTSNFHSKGYDRRGNRRWESVCQTCTTKNTKRAYATGAPTGARAQTLWHVYRLTVEWYNRILESQGGVCAVCRKEESHTGIKWLSVDHSHRCCPGKRSCGNCIRGLLCRSCNSRLAVLEDRDWIKRANEYLESWSGE
jgi:hypothetical protein